MTHFLTSLPRISLLLGQRHRPSPLSRDGARGPGPGATSGFAGGGSRLPLPAIAYRPAAISDTHELDHSIVLSVTHDKCQLIKELFFFAPSRRGRGLILSRLVFSIITHRCLNFG